ncbi:MAG TPA: metallophosphoesterase family protein [Firmicutes bacterium]|nr:metallophosphoesterase family protein [Bacillota bacterium]
MRIGIISDTHIPTRAKHLPPALFDLLAGVELILHAGDFVTMSVVEELETIAPVEAVAGNMDPLELQRRFGRKKTLVLSGFRIGLIHGDIGTDRAKTPERALQAFADDRVDAVIFGHSHQPFLRRENGILLFNPGSATDRRREPRTSCGLLTLGETIEARHIYL